MEIGIYTFGDVPPAPRGQRTVVEAQRLRDLLEEVELADQAGLDVYGVGEHHRPDYAISAPAVVLAALAARSTRNPPNERRDGAQLRRPRALCRQ